MQNNTLWGAVRGSEPVCSAPGRRVHRRAERPQQAGECSPSADPRGGLRGNVARSRGPGGLFRLGASHTRRGVGEVVASAVLFDTDVLIADALIAATALAENVPLVSKNQRDFRFIADIRLL